MGAACCFGDSVFEDAEVAPSTEINYDDPPSSRTLKGPSDLLGAHPVLCPNVCQQAPLITPTAPGTPALVLVQWQPTQVPDLREMPSHSLRMPPGRVLLPSCYPCLSMEGSTPGETVVVCSPRAATDQVRLKVRQYSATASNASTISTDRGYLTRQGSEPRLPTQEEFAQLAQTDPDRYNKIVQDLKKLEAAYAEYKEALAQHQRLACTGSVSAPPKRPVPSKQLSGFLQS